MNRPLLNAPEYMEEPQSPTNSRTPDLRPQIDRLEERIFRLERAQEQIKRDAVVLLLNVLGKAMRSVAKGEVDLSDAPASTDSSSDKWDQIKQRLAPRLRQAIDILLLQGPMKRTQIANALRMDYSNCTKNVISVLLRQGLIVDNGGDLSLRSL